MTEIAGRVALVTGGGSGIGRGLSRALAGESASVVVADVQEEKAAEVAAEIVEAGGAALGVACDVSDRASVARVKESAREAFGPVSLLFANAGVTAVQPLVEMSSDDIDWILAVDLHGVVHCLEAFLPEMVSRGSGHVVATSSLAGLIPDSLPDHGPYAAAKAGLIGLMLNLRHELSERGVGCTVVCPGGVATGIGQSFANRPARFGGPSSRGVSLAKDIKVHVPVTFRQPEEVARMVLRAVQRDRPMVVTDASQRAFFFRSYVELVQAAFDDAEEFDEEHGTTP